LKRILSERGEDEEDSGSDPELMRSLLADARKEQGLPPLPEDLAADLAASSKQKQNSLDEDNTDDEDSEPAGASPTSALRNSITSPPLAATVAGPPTAQTPPAPRKRLTCCLFADSNTHVLLTGDSGGRVDVYRLEGVSYPGEEGDSSGRVDALLQSIASLKTDGTRGETN